MPLCTVLLVLSLTSLAVCRPTNQDEPEDPSQEILFAKPKPRIAPEKKDILDVNKGLGYFEGDIIMEPDNQASARNAIKDSSRKWTNNVIPYVLQEAYGFESRMLFFKALSEFNVRTCVTFRPKEDSDKNYLYIKRASGCYSGVGMGGGGMQSMSIGGGCEYKGTIQHEAMHAIGFWHEQSRYDRDDYVIILWDNIQEGQEYNFKEYSSDQITTLNLPYDFSSLMHYGAKYFSKNNNYTIEVAPSHRDEATEGDLGQRAGFTYLDLTKIRTLYNCDMSKYQGWSDWTGWSECDTECMKVRWRFCNEEDETTCVGESEEIQSCDNCVLDAASDCGESLFTNWEGSISSPLFPYDYVNNANCEYKIQKTFEQYPVYLSFVEFSIEYEPSYCGYDNLKIFDSDKTKANMAICGDRMPADQLLSSSEAMLRFQSDYVTTSRGFKAFYFNVPVLHHCPFEYDPLSYGWSQDTVSDDFDWTWNSGATPSSNTGPAADHSLQNSRGHYLFIETSSPRVANDVAKIISPVFEFAPEEYCLQFFYHMYGNYIGTLNVYAVHDDTEKPIVGFPTFSLSGAKGNEWKSAFISAPKGVTYKFVFEAIRGGGYLSDIAIDDIRLFGISCQELE